MITLFLADSCPLMAEGIRQAILSAPQVAIAGVCHSRDWLFSWLASQPSDLLLLDPTLGKPNEIGLCDKLQQKFPNLKILLFSNEDNPLCIRKLFEAGIRGILPRTANREELLQAAQAVMRGETYLHEFAKSKMLSFSLGLNPPPRNYATLTKREHQILQLIVQEYTTREIAEKLYIEFCTVETHRKNLIQKLGVKNTAGLVRVAVEQQLIIK